jgi:hypothetical protein
MQVAVWAVVSCDIPKAQEIEKHAISWKKYGYSLLG